MVKQREGEQEKVWGGVEWIGQRLKELREARGMTGEDVADAMGCKYTRVYDTESARHDIRASTLLRMLLVLNVELKHFCKTAPLRSEWRSKNTPEMRRMRREEARAERRRQATKRSGR